MSDNLVEFGTMVPCLEEDLDLFAVQSSVSGIAKMLADAVHKAFETSIPQKAQAIKARASNWTEAMTLVDKAEDQIKTAKKLLASLGIWSDASVVALQEAIHVAESANWTDLRSICETKIKALESDPVVLMAQSKTKKELERAVQNQKAAQKTERQSRLAQAIELDPAHPQQAFNLLRTGIPISPWGRSLASQLNMVKNSSLASIWDELGGRHDLTPDEKKDFGTRVNEIFAAELDDAGILWEDSDLRDLNNFLWQVSKVRQNLTMAQRDTLFIGCDYVPEFRPAKKSAPKSRHVDAETKAAEEVAREKASAMDAEPTDPNFRCFGSEKKARKAAAQIGAGPVELLNGKWGFYQPQTAE